MNLASALLKQIIELQDTETWSALREHYLPREYHTLYKVINGYSEKYHTLPTFEDLKLMVRDSNTKEKVYAVESVETDVPPDKLLAYIKSEFAQGEVLNKLDDFVDNSIAFEDAEEAIEHLHQIVLDVEERVELEVPQETMSRIELFDSEEELGRYLPLGLNRDFDLEYQFSPTDLILIGGPKGAGKSITCNNIADYTYGVLGKTAIIFTIEMEKRQVLQRACSIATGVPFLRLRAKNLSVTEWYKVAEWWATRFDGGSEQLQAYKDDRDFSLLHKRLISNCELLPTRQLDIVYDPNLTLSKIRAELDKKLKSKLDVGVIIIDYINQVKRSSIPHRNGQYEWTEQIEISKALKSMAQEYKTPIVSPYQVDASGEARFAKGLLDAPDAAFSLESFDEEEGSCMAFTCRKMRNGPKVDFCSAVDWSSLKIGPESALTPKEREALAERTGEDVEDL